jgi:hypothetical protein
MNSNIRPIYASPPTPLCPPHVGRYLIHRYGATFLIPYFFALFVFGYPILLLEYAIGQFYQVPDLDQSIDTPLGFKRSSFPETCSRSIRSPVAEMERYRLGGGHRELSSNSLLQHSDFLVVVSSLKFQTESVYILENPRRFNRVYLILCSKPDLPWRYNPVSFFHDSVIRETSSIDVTGYIVPHLAMALLAVWTILWIGLSWGTRVCFLSILTVSWSFMTSCYFSPPYFHVEYTMNESVVYLETPTKVEHTMPCFENRADTRDARTIRTQYGTHRTAIVESCRLGCGSRRLRTMALERSVNRCTVVIRRVQCVTS